MKTIRLIIPGVLFILLSGTNLSASDDTEIAMKSEIKESYVMLYYKDMTAPRHFYADILGLESTYEDDWVSLYRLTASSLVGVVKEGNESYHKVQESNAVMLSIVVDNVDVWYSKITANSDVVILQEINNNENVAIRAFLIQDPGGYSVEVFQWLNK